MIEIGRLTEYRLVAQVECGTKSRDELLDHIGFLYRKSEMLTNDVTRWRESYGKLEAESRPFAPLFRMDTR